MRYWLQSWGASWGNSWGSVASGVLTGDIDIEVECLPEITGNASFVAKSDSQYVGARPGGRHGVIPSSAFIVAEYQRQEIERQLSSAKAGVKSGDASIDVCSVVDVSASGRIKCVKLVGAASVEPVCSTDLLATAVFFDTELEMVALLLAA